MLKLRTLTILAVALVTLLIFSYFVTENHSNSNEVVVRLDAPFPAIDFAPFYVAKNKGWLEETLADLNAKPSYVGSLGEIALTNEALATNQVDMFLTSTIPPVIGRSAGIEMQITWLSCVLNSEIIVQKGLPSNEFANLKGLKVGTLTGSDSHYWMLRSLAEKGYSEDFLEMIYYSRPDDIMAAFASQDLDSVALFPPFPEQSLVTGDAVVVGEEIYPIEVVMVARTAFIQDHPELVKAINATLERAKDWINKNPGEAKSIVSEVTGIAAEIVDISWSKLDWETHINAEMIARMQAKADFLFDLGKIDNKVDVEMGLLSNFAKN